MNRKGFTLVELLAVLFIILLIATLVFVSISEKGEKFKDISYKEFEQTIISSTKRYIFSDEEIINLLKRGETFTVTIEELINYKYLDGNNLKNPKTYKKIDQKKSRVEVLYSNYEYFYTVILQ